MADSLAVSITVPLGNVPQFVATLGANLEADTPCSEQVLLAAAATGEELALTLRLQPDPALAEFRNEHPDIECSEPGHVALGYLFTKARLEPGALEFTFYSTSRAIVQVLKESKQVRALLHRLGSLGHPPEVRITDEWNDVTTLHAHGEA